MKICGVIAEFNPLHHAHAKVLAEARKIGPDGVVIILSGNFVQRGRPAIMNKWYRTKSALLCGADLVIELPAVFSLAPAQRFALGGVTLLHSLGTVTDILFGAETDDLSAFSAIAEILENEPNDFSEQLKLLLKDGTNFPAARARALQEILSSSHLPLSEPNNILAIEYLRALHRLSSDIKPHILKRFGPGHHDPSIIENTASATAIRSLIVKKEAVQGLLPAPSYALLNDAISSGEAPVTQECFQNIVFAALRTKSASELKNISEVCEGLENRMTAAANQTASIEELIRSIKCKRYTRTKIERILWKALLGITQSFDTCVPEYIRVLGMNRTGMHILSEAKNKARLPIITKPSVLRGNGLFELEVRASGIYSLAYSNQNRYKNEFQTSPIIVEDECYGL